MWGISFSSFSPSHTLHNILVDVGSCIMLKTRGGNLSSMKTKFCLRAKPYVPGTSCFGSKHIRIRVCPRVGAGSMEWRDYKRTWAFGGWCICSLSVMVLWMHTYVQHPQIVHGKYLQFTVNVTLGKLKKTAHRNYCR